VFADTTAAVLAQAAAEGDTARIRQLIRAGADPDAESDRGVTLLQWALLHRSAAGLEALLEGSADPARADSTGETVVHYAAKANNPRYLDILLAHQADPNTPNTVTGITPLMSALMGNREVQFRRLLAAGTSARLVDRFGNTALHLAAKINAHEASSTCSRPAPIPSPATGRGRRSSTISA
jgi:ankyrin repeat protein